MRLGLRRYGDMPLGLFSGRKHLGMVLPSIQCLVSDAGVMGSDSRLDVFILAE